MDNEINDNFIKESECYFDMHGKKWEAVKYFPSTMQWLMISWSKGGYDCEFFHKETWSNFQKVPKDLETVVVESFVNPNGLIETYEVGSKFHEICKGNTRDYRRVKTVDLKKTSKGNL